MDLTGALGLLRRRWLALVLCLASSVAGGLLVTHRTPAAYQATSTVIVTMPSAPDIATSLQGVQLTTQLLQSYATVAMSREAATKLKVALDLPETPDQLRAKISVAPQSGTLLMNVAAIDADPVRAVSLSDAMSQILIDSVAALERRKTNQAVAQVVDHADGSAVQVSPRSKRNLAVAIALGLLVGLAIAVLIESFDRSVKGPRELSDLLEAPVLGMVPRLRAAARSPSATVDNPMTPDAEAYRALRTAIRFVDVDSPLQTILITSAGPGEGKTTTASHFAVALAQSGERVALIDADLRRGTVLNLLGLPEGAGVTSVVTGAAPLEVVLQPWRDLLNAMGTGPLPPNPSEICGSQAMATLLEDLREMVDVVVIDAPPVLPVTDAVALSTQVDGVVIVARDGRTDRTNLTETRRRLDGVGAHVVGCVLNEVKARGEHYADYRYLSPQLATPGLRERLTGRLRR